MKNFEQQDTFTEKKLILFGAGKSGLRALHTFGKEHVCYFCDNDQNKQNTEIEGIPILSFQEMLEIYSAAFVIMITPESCATMIGQLEKAGISVYLLYKEEWNILPIYCKKETVTQERHNNVLRQYIEKSSHKDLLEDVTDFLGLVKEAICWSKENGEPLNYYTPGKEEEGLRYGNVCALAKYAGIEITIGDYMPLVSHIDLMPFYTPAHNYKSAVIFSGEYYKDKVHDRAPWVPVFSVGPFIHYAESIYSHEEYSSVKDRTGKLLLAFLPHTLEGVERNVDGEFFVDELLKRYKDHFDSIWLCMYFTDLTEDIYIYAEEKGIHVVTAGFRFDPKFDCRLKTMINMADAIVCGDIGTFITYGLYYKKPIGRIDMPKLESGLEVQFKKHEVEVLATNDYIDFNKHFYELFNSDISFNVAKEEWMNPYGGFDRVRSKAYIRDIFTISRDIYNMNLKGSSYSDSVKKTYIEYYEKRDFKKLYMLKEAVGTFLD